MHDTVSIILFKKNAAQGHTFSWAQIQALFYTTVQVLITVSTILFMLYCIQDKQMIHNELYACTCILSWLILDSVYVHVDAGYMYSIKVSYCARDHACSTLTIRQYSYQTLVSIIFVHSNMLFHVFISLAIINTVYNYVRQVVLRIAKDTKQCEYDSSRQKNSLESGWPQNYSHKLPCWEVTNAMLSGRKR